MERCAGVVMPMFSVPANQGLGDLGQKTVRMIDCNCGCRLSCLADIALQAKGRSILLHALSSFAVIQFILI